MDTSSLEELCRAVSLQLARVKGITAIVLGGSQARGRARPDSDVDIGLYYESETPFSIPELDAVVCELDDRCQSGLVTGFGDWGAGVNGGGWLKIGGRKVDLLYRDLNKVSLAIESCRLGRPEAFYQLGHPQGFQSQIWMAEVHSCRVLSDPFGVITRLKELTTDYPPLLRQALIEKHLFDAGFELMIARGPAARGDLWFVTG